MQSVKPKPTSFKIYRKVLILFVLARKNSLYLVRINGNYKGFAQLNWCRRRDLNPHEHSSPPPQDGVSTNSTTSASILLINFWQIGVHVLCGFVQRRQVAVCDGLIFWEALFLFDHYGVWEA